MKWAWKSRDVPSAIFQIGRPEVLLETMLSFLRRRSMRATSARFGSSSSMMASTIQSASAMRRSSASRLPMVTRFAVSGVKNAGGFAFFIRSKPALTTGMEMSSR